MFDIFHQLTSGASKLAVQIIIVCNVAILLYLLYWVSYFFDKLFQGKGKEMISKVKVNLENKEVIFEGNNHGSKKPLLKGWNKWFWKVVGIGYLSAVVIAAAPFVLFILLMLVVVLLPFYFIRKFKAA